MDKNTQELGNKLLRELHDANQLLRAISHPRQNDEQSADEQYEAGANAKWYQSLNWWKPRLEMAGIVAAILYAPIAYNQWRDANTNFREGQRAWVLVSSFEGPITFKEDTDIPLNFFAKNSGASPALEVHARSFPSGEGPYCRIDMSPLVNKATVPIAPQQEQHFSGAMVHLSPRCIIAMDNGTGSIILTGEITYKDIFQKPHTTHFKSRWNVGTQTFQATEDGNYAD